MGPRGQRSRSPRTGGWNPGRERRGGDQCTRGRDERPRCRYPRGGICRAHHVLHRRDRPNRNQGIHLVHCASQHRNQPGGRPSRLDYERDVPRGALGEGNVHFRPDGTRHITGAYVRNDADHRGPRVPGVRVDRDQPADSRPGISRSRCTWQPAYGGSSCCAWSSERPPPSW